MAGNRHTPFLVRVLVLTVASFLVDQSPAIALNHPNCVTNLHDFRAVSI